MRSPVPCLALVSALSGCGLVLPVLERGPIETDPDRNTSPETYAADIEVRDFLTMARVPGATVEVTTDVPGYAPELRLDDAGIWHLRVDARRTRKPLGDRIMNDLLVRNPRSGEVWVHEVTLRARAGERCSSLYRTSPAAFPGSMVLFLRDCGREATVDHAP